MASQQNKTSKVEKSDAEKIKIDWGYMLSSLRTMDPRTEMDAMVEQSKSVLEHMFNNHEYCDASWCKFLQANELGQVYRPHKSYTKETDKEMYDQLKNVLEKFCSPEILE